jgi:hypothetical protein
LLRCFGAKVGDETHPYPGSRIWAPWNLEAGIGVGIADGAEIYNPAPVILGDFVTISQDAYLCSAGHDYTHPEFPLVTSPIEVLPEAWIAARAIVPMGVTIGQGCVVGAGSVVRKNTPDWTVQTGNPCISDGGELPAGQPFGRAVHHGDTEAAVNAIREFSALPQAFRAAAGSTAVALYRSQISKSRQLSRAAAIVERA